MKNLLRVLLGALLAGCAAAPPSPPARRPNVLFILTDDQRWDCIGLAAGSKVPTPEIDRLGREGVYFPNAFCTTSLCSPSRASILSGLYAHAHGVSNNFTEYPDAMPSWPRSLQASGYRTAYIGKYHMGEDNDDPRPGFDHFVTHRGQGKYWDTEFRANGGERKLVRGYYTTIVTDMAEEWIRRQDPSKPWALLLGHKAPHSFYQPEPRHEKAFDRTDVSYPSSAFQLEGHPDWYRERLDTWHGIYGPLFDFRKTWPDRSPAGVAAFAAMVRAYRSTILSVDDSVGRLVRLLRERGELENTILVFTADNGLLEGEHGMIDKRTMHEPSIRVPLVVRYPGLTSPSKPRVVDAMVLTEDFAPSLLDLCGAAPLPKVHGRSWTAIARGESDPGWRKSFLYHYNYERQFPYTPNIRGVRTERWKYVRYPAGGGAPDRHGAELFDLLADPDETRNRAADPALAPVVRELQAELARLLEATGASPDVVPVDEGIKKALPDAKIR
ncbi:MAG: sulfatase [Planctomycetaceae bacterium]|nr:sulfatase [Planctomycetaceae bacterium]